MDRSQVRETRRALFGFSLNAAPLFARGGPQEEVEAIETTLSRGRLYRRSGDRAHAAAALRSAARSRAAGRLRLGPAADQQTLVRDLARQSGRSEADLWNLLGAGSGSPTSDRELIALANALAELDREARRP